MENLPFFDYESNPASRTATLWLNRPEKRNLLNWDFWMGLESAVKHIEADGRAKAVVLAGRGSDFTLGLDLKDLFVQLGPILQEKTGDSRELLMLTIRKMQAGFNAMYNSRLIWIAAVHGHCLGAGLDMVAACDLALATADAIVSLRETRIGIVADMGSLQRLPARIGLANTRLMAYTGRDFSGAECRQMGLFNQTVESYDQVLVSAQALAAEVAANPGIVLRGVKQVLAYSTAHSDADSMDYVATWNAAFLETEDFAEAVAAFLEKRPPRFK